MRIYLTFDYELFFGEKSGSVEKCMIQPTNDLLRIAEGKNVFYTFFVDVGYLIKAEQYPELEQELKQVKTQINEIIAKGHDVQLHIHPHWEKANYSSAHGWEMNTTSAYKLSDFDPEDAGRIVADYKRYLDELIGRKSCAFRAGGWCIQPFFVFRESFIQNQIKVDSSVIPGDFMLTDHYALDFREAPLKSRYQFDTDVCCEVADGPFTELPISSLRYSPLFFWQLYLLGRISPENHKMIGDGQFLNQGGRRKRVLKQYTNNHVSTDGYYAKKLNAGLEKLVNTNQDEMVVIGHPKGNTIYSLRKLEEFISEHHNNYSFTTFHQEFCN